MKHIVLGVTGSIAAYKACDLVSQLSKIKDIEIDVIMTKAACEFITPLTFESLLHKKVYLDPFISLDGQIIFGQVAANQVSESKSLAKPLTTLAMLLALAGTMTIKSAF